MTKSAKHKKLMKTEKKKIKAGKRLKPAQNETKTDFKSRKIILKEQLAEKSESSLVTKKKLSINELLSRLSHYNVNVRQDGLNGLKELVNKNSKMELGPYLSLLFTKLNPCLLDGDHQVRTSAIKLLEVIIMKIGNMITPYFSLLASHLSCAMVHLDSGVQGDSLVLMDVLLINTPSLIAQNCNRILKNFLHLISRQVESKRSAKGFSLISNPTSKLASIKWRIKLFKSLSQYLEAILSQRAKLESTIPVSQWQVITTGCFPSLVKQDGNENSSFSTRLLVTESEAENFVTTMLPLLFQSWAEAEHKTATSNKAITSGTPLNPVAIELLLYISEIVLHFWDVLEIVTQKSPLETKWFADLMAKHFDFDVLSDFPFSPLEGQKNHKERESRALCQRLNIHLSSLAFRYRGKNQELLNRVSRCYIDILNGRDGSSELNVQALTPSVTSLLQETSGLSLETRRKLLLASLACYQRLKSKSRFVLLQVPLQASDFACRRLWNSKALYGWMEQVVKDTIENASEERLLELMLQWKLRNTPGFNYIMSKNKSVLRERIKGNSKLAQKPGLTVII